MTPSQSIPARPPVRSIESVLANRWARVLVPSLSDLFFVAMLVWLFVGGPYGWQSLLADADVGWHIRTGDYILNTGSVPHTDLYSFSKPAAAWYAWEWLTDVIDAGLHRAAGLKGVVLFAGVLIAAFGTTLIRRMVWRGSHLLIAMIVALLAVGASTIHFLARPHIFTLLLLSISIWMIEADRERPGRRIWLLVPLTALWTNLHGGFLALIAILGLTAVGTAAEVWFGNGRTIRDALRYASLTGACALASLANPYGWNLHLHVVEYLRSDWIRQVVQEFQSPSFRTESMMQFEALFLLGLIVSAGLFARRRIVEGLWILFWAHMALGSVRHVPIFVTVTAPIIAVEVSTWWRRATAGARKGSLPMILNQMAADSAPAFRRTSILPFAAVAVLILMGSPIRWPKDFPDKLFPTGLVHDHADLIARSRVFTTDQWGDYLIYKNPDQKVFVDGRSDFYGPEVGNEFLAVVNGMPTWRTVMDKYGFDLVLMPANTAIVQLLRTDPAWRELDSRDDGDGGKRILLVRMSASVPSTGNSPAEPRF